MIKNIQKAIDNRKLKPISGNKVKYDFSKYKTFKEFFRDLYYRKIAKDDAEAEQRKFHTIIGVIEEYTRRKKIYRTITS